MQAAEAVLSRLVQIEIGETAPDADRQIANQWMLQLAEPAEQAGGEASWDAVGQQKVDVFMTNDRGNRGAQRFHDIGILPDGAIRRRWK